MRKLPLYVALSELVEARLNCMHRGQQVFGHSVTETELGAWKGMHERNLLALVAEHMPSGSGVDSGTQLDLNKSEAQKLVFTTAFHHMNDHGTYDGWTEHQVTVTPVFGGVKIEISGRDRNQIKEYLHDIFAEALEKKVEVQKQDEPIRGGRETK